ncbi:MAG: CDP-alcohol phosphatidyltransferase family protein [Clostridia bacterium]|nr:CDP-alcohol phosphatidyltransferase family protein [Clostridia bacterium]
MNIPNILTLIRIALIPVTAYYFHTGQTVLASAVFITACLTDILDGYIARRFNMITNVGKLLDPLADKGIQITLLISLAMTSLVPWTVIIIIVCKELIQCVCGYIMYRSGIVVNSKAEGKISTVVTSLCVVTIMLFGRGLGKIPLLVFQWLPVVFAIPAFLSYSVMFYNYMIKKKAQAE